MRDSAAITLPRMPVLPRLLFAVLAACGIVAASTCSSKEGHESCTASPPPSQPYILVVGSINVDITMQVTRLPHHGETITARSPSTATAVGGKGANTAVAAAKLLNNTDTEVQHRHASAFICQFGNDAHAAWLQSVLLEHGVDVSGSGHSTDLPSGQGIVMLEQDGSVSSVVVGGSNTAWADAELSSVKQRAASAGIVLLQREVPEQVNEAAAQAAHAAGVPVLQDVGGEDRPITDQLLRLITYLVPNESELQRLTGLPTGSDEQVAEAARRLQARGAANVLVTLGERGSLLLAQDGQVLRQRACPVPGGVVLDATGAGDAFRAAFAVSLVERRSLRHSLQFASVAGAIAASRLGAVPSLPARHEVDQLLAQWLAQPGPQAGDATHLTPTPAAQRDALAQPASPPAATTAAREDAQAPGPHDGFPLKFASRLNSMKERLDLWPDNRIRNDTLKLLARQATARGLDLIDFNFPQHLHGLEYQQVRDALAAAGLGAGAVCIRFEDDMRLGAFSNPDAPLRAKAVQLVVQGCRWARELGAQELVVWSAFDGYDYTLSIDYASAWQRVVESYQQVCDACPDLKVSIEFKPTDESSRFSIVPSTGAALLLAHQVDRPNFGLTLDLGHLLMAGENPAQSIAMAAAAGRLFGLQLGDGHLRLGAEDGLMFGAANPRTALEVVLTLQRVGYHGHVYFDTFPRNEDPVKEAEYNVRRFKSLWAKAQLLIDRGIVPLLHQHDAMGVAELLEQLDLL